MQCIIYDNFVKTLNSTKRPGSVAGEEITQWEFTMNIKEGSDVFRPVLLISPSPDDGSTSYFRPAQANYVYIPSFQKYYFIEHIVWFGVGWEVHCIVDTLATYRNALFTEWCYVTRTSCPSLINHKLIDSMFPADNVLITQKDQILTGSISGDIGGTFILGVIGSASFASGIGGAVAYYTMTGDALNRFISYLFTPSTYSFNADDITQSFFNPMQYISSCKWTPFLADSSPTTQIRYGWFNAGGSSFNSNGIGFISSQTSEWYLGEWLQIYHPYPSDLNDYRNSSIYCSYKLYLPFIGEYALPADILQHYNYLGVKFVLDHVSCDIMCEVKVGNGAEFQWQNGIHALFIQATAGCDIALAGATRDYVRLGKDILGVIGNGFQLNITGALSNVLDGIAANQPKVSELGGNGSRALGGLDPYATLYSYYREVNTINVQTMGQPCGKRVQLQAAQGYFVQIRNPKFTLSASSAEMTDMRQKLEEGIWVE